MRIAQSQTRRPGTAAVAETPCRCAQPPQRGQTQDPAHAVVSLHGAIGNQAVQRLLRSGAIQAKLAVSQPDDPYEREADRVADQVLQMPEPAVEGKSIEGHGRSPRLQRTCGPCQEEETVQRKEAPAAAVASTPPVGSSAFSPRGAGHALPESVRGFFEPRFGYDFSRVRLHTDSQAAESARAVNALAYTVGRDVVFGAGRYAPATPEGRTLLAHELTHVVQQSQPPGGKATATALQLSDPGNRIEHKPGQVADGLASSSPQTRSRPVWSPYFVQRQGQAGAGAQPAAGWQGCPADRISQLNAELADALSWVGEAVADLQRTPQPAHTTGALRRYLSTDPAHVSGTIVPTLQQMLVELQGGPANFQCQSQAQCVALNPDAGDAGALATHPITLCDRYFSLLAILAGGSLFRTATLIHEVGHHAGLGGDTYEFTWPFPGLSTNEQLGNADSFAAFVVTNHYPMLPPVTGPTGMGLAVGPGLLFRAGTASPRFVVTAEYDVTLARRVFHFFDLHLGVRADVDTSGLFLGSFTLGTRVFAPVSVSSTPLFLDLRGGVALGNDPAIVDVANREVFGPAAEARIGFQRGHFAGSISYLRIWDLMRDNSDIDALSVFGEILF